MAWRRQAQAGKWTKNRRKSLMSYEAINHKDWIKGIKNGCWCIVEIRGTQGCALVGDSARS